MFNPSFLGDFFTSLLSFFTDTPMMLVTTLYIVILCIAILKQIIRLFN